MLYNIHTNTPFLTHYIIVRRDLPVGVVAAMVTHAAGESAALYEKMLGEFDGAYAVVLAVKTELRLEKAKALLDTHDIAYTEVRESSAPYNGALMALGLMPIERDEVEEILNDFQLLHTLDNPSSEA